jgi:hypothetical protein
MKSPTKQYQHTEVGDAMPGEPVQSPSIQIDENGQAYIKGEPLDEIHIEPENKKKQ